MTGCVALTYSYLPRHSFYLFSSFTLYLVDAGRQLPVMIWYMCTYVSDVYFHTTHIPGCGTGNYTLALSRHVGRVTGLELNGGMLSQARGKTAAVANVEIHGGNVLEMPFSDGEFDGVVCNQVCTCTVTNHL